MTKGELVHGKENDIYTFFLHQVHILWISLLEVKERDLLMKYSR